MSSGAAVQLAQQGREDLFVSGNPSSTFFKSVYKRHTNFTIQPSEVTFTGSQDLDDENVIDIPLNGDFIKQIYIKMELPPIVPTLVTQPFTGFKAHPVWCNNISFAILEYAELVVGGQSIQRITGEYCYIQSQLRTQKALYPALQEITNNHDDSPSAIWPTSGTFYIPLYFYFHWDPALALPIVALNRQDVKIKIKFKKLTELIQSYIGSGANFNLLDYIVEADMEPIKFTPFVEYIYIDIVERSKFQDGTELTYLIDQSEVFNLPSVVGAELFANAKLPFKNLVKELFFIVQRQYRVEPDSENGNQWFQYGDITVDKKIDFLELKFNGKTRLASDIATGWYLKFIQPMMYHTRTSMENIHSYSFALNPESSLPTGSVNFSRIVDVELNLKFGGTTDRDIRIHATSMNVLKIANNLCCLMFK